MNQQPPKTNMVRRLPTPLTIVIALINMAEGACCIAVGVVGIAGMLTILRAAESLRRSGREDSDEIMTLSLVLPPVIIGVGALAFASGIGILFLRAWGRLLAMVYAAACFGCASVALFVPGVAAMGSDAPVDFRAHVVGCVLAMAFAGFVIYMFHTPRWLALFFPAEQPQSQSAPLSQGS